MNELRKEEGKEGWKAARRKDGRKEGWMDQKREKG